MVVISDYRRYGPSRRSARWEFTTVFGTMDMDRAGSDGATPAPSTITEARATTTVDIRAR